jgi:YidC/Oxa1 family membrane protein insertase
MRAMQALQPQVKALQDKYKSDRQLLNQKMMEFYRENNVSPFGSCLPLLLQMPVFLGLYYMLRSQGTATWWTTPVHIGAFASVWHSLPVGWLWIPDITKFNIILMFLYIASQFVASWQMARKGAGQQRIIAYFMPVMIGIFMYVYRWPAGLFIYWFTSNLWTIAQQFVAEKIAPVPVPVAATPVKEKTTPARSTGKTSARPTGKTSARPAGKSGGKTSGQKTGQQGKAASSPGQRPNRGAGGPKSSR